METLTPRQEQALKTIAGFWRQGRPPTTGELIEELGLGNPNSLRDLLSPLERKGYLTIQGGIRGRQRHIQLTPQSKAYLGFGIPVLGDIPAGPLQEAVQESDEWIECAAALLRPRPGDFLLRVKGDSMMGVGIMPRDLVLLRPGIAVRSGEVVAAQIERAGTGSFEATLKHLDLLEEGRLVRLRAANPDYPDRVFDARLVSVAGVFRGLIREANID